MKAFLTVLLLPALAHAATIQVGDAKPFSRLQDAVAKAAPGDEIQVFPHADSSPYLKTALLIKTRNLTIHGMAKEPIKLDGANFNYSGAGQVPRAVIQFDPGSDGSTLDGFDLANAHNDSFNGAGIRITQANDITIKNCVIHSNDMGIMSNGRFAAGSAANQLIEGCTITGNGTQKQPGQNHNLYLGGTSVTVRGCEIASSLTGHNLKSRAHFNLIEYNFIHDSANRELDLVDEKGNTDAPNSDSILLGNIITKAPNMTGNKAVIHFGQDGGQNRTGTLFLVHNTITTPYISPVISLSTPGATAAFFNNLIEDQNAHQAGILVEARAGAVLDKLAGEGNTIAAAFARNMPPSIKTGAPFSFEKIPLGWPENKKEPGLLQYVTPGHLQLRTDSAAGAKGP